MKHLLVSLCLLAAFAATPLRAASAPDIFAENVRTTEPLSPEEEREKFHLPPGFKIQLVAAEPDLRKPMNMAFDSVGRLWITESREYPFAATNDATARDTIRIFSDFDENGRAGKVTTFATNLNIPIGLYPFRSPRSSQREEAPTNPKLQTPNSKPNQSLLTSAATDLTWKCVVWSIPNIYLLEDTDGDGIADKKTLLYGPFDTTRDTHGNQASFRRGADGWIYATHGFNNQSRVRGRDGHEIFLPSGNIYRFKLDGSRIEHWTHGQVNPFGLCFDPLGNLYSADCHSSPIYQLLRGACYPSFGRPHDGLGFGPTTIQHSHGSTAIAGIVYISDPAWPAEYQNNIFIGNVMTSRINRDQINFTGSTSKGTEMPDFLSTDDPWFRPVDLQFGPDGALWVADFYNRIIGHYEVPLVHPGRDRERGRLWRIVPPSGADVRGLSISGPNTNLMQELASVNPVRRSLALEELSQKLSENWFDPLFDTVTKAAQSQLATSSELGRANLMTGSLWLLQRAGRLWGFERESILVEALSDPNPMVRCQALRIVTDFAFQPEVRLGDVITVPPMSWPLRESTMRALSDTNAFVRRAAADALGANPSAQQFQTLLELLRQTSPEDTHLVHNVRLAIQQQFRNVSDFNQVLADRLTATDAQALASIVASIPNSGAAKFLLEHLKLRTEPADVLARYITHAARYAPDAELGTVATLAQKQFTADLDTQAALFKSLQEGLASRGGALPPELHAWGAELAGQLLATTPPQATWTYAPLNPEKPGRNPFAFEERSCADGQKARLMSSLPLGETLTGILRSPVFVLPKQLSFYLCGHDGMPQQPAGKKNFVRLRAAGSDTTLREAKVPRNDTAQKITWDLADLAGQRAFIEVTDGDDGKAYAWLAFGRFAPALPELALQDTQGVGKRQLAGAELTRSLKLAALEPAVAKLFAEAKEAPVRAAAGRAWLALGGAAALPSAAAVMRDATQPESLRAELAAQLGESAEAGQLAVVVTALTNAPTRLQTKLGVALVSTPAGAEQLLAAVEAGRVPARVLQDRTLADRLGASPARDAKVRLAALVKNLPPADAQLQKQIEARRAGFGAAQSSAARGAEVFTKACAVCHQLEGKGALVGPQLDGIGGRGLERLLEDILDPNRNVDKAFRMTVFVLKDGESVSGLYRREEGATLVYALANGQEARVPKADVKERRETETSLMPANFIEALTAAELNDLLAFLLGQKGK